MDRRTFISRAGTATVALTAASSTVLAGSGRDSVPNDSVSAITVYPFPGDDDPSDDDTHTEVPAGDWIRHQALLVSATAEGPTWLENYLNSVDLHVRIDDETIEDPAQYFGEPFELSDDRWGEWGAMWKYVTPPKPPGVHTFEISEEVVETRKLSGKVREPGFTRTTTGTYQVTPGGRGNGPKK